MVLYVCEKCNNKYSNKTDYTRHCNRKKSCSKLLQATQFTPTLEQKCPDCGKIFTRRFNLNRHINGRCKAVKVDNKIEILEKKIEEQTSKIEELVDIIKELKEEGIGSITNNNNETNQNKTVLNNSEVETINNVTNNIHLVKFGEEDLKKVALEAIKYMNGYEGFYNLIKDVHFNENIPENHNIYVSNSKFKNACVYDGERWLLRNLDEVREELIEKKYDYLCDRFDILKGENKITSSMEKKFQRFCKNYSELTGKKEKDFKESIDLILYNNRDLVKSTKKTIKNQE